MKQAVLNVGVSIFLVMIELTVATMIVAPRWVARQLSAAFRRQAARLRQGFGQLIPNLPRGRLALGRSREAR